MLTLVGIDVQAELKRKEITPPAQGPSIPQATPIQRPQQRHIHHLSSSSIPVVQKGVAFGSPQIRSSPSSQMSSPISAKSPTFGMQGGMNLTQANFQVQHSQPAGSRQQQLRSQTFPSINGTANRPGLQAIAPNLGSDVAGHGQWPSPFQTHNEQLGKLAQSLWYSPPELIVHVEQEYGSSHDIMEDGVENLEVMHAGPGPYPQRFQQQGFTSAQPSMAMTMAADNLAQSPSQGGFGQVFDPSDPMLDADPFGLSASMHFPTPFSFQESSIRN